MIIHRMALEARFGKLISQKVIPITVPRATQYAHNFVVEYQSSVVQSNSSIRTCPNSDQAT
jgi:hypothetical protein